MINYIGDISKMDAEVLKEFAEQATNFLEAGSGGSTQVIANYCKGDVTSVESDPAWIEKTRRNIDLLGINKQVKFILYDDFINQEHTQQYDCVFVDLVDGYRKDFGILAFDKLLKPGGIWMMHDQRRTGDIHNMAEVIRWYSAYIDTVLINYRESNITVIHKRDNPNALFYSDWNLDEKKASWQIGQGDVPEEEKENLKKEKQ